MEYEADDVKEDVLVHDEVAFFEFLDQEFDDVDDKFEDSEDYTRFLYELYDRAFWNHLHSLSLARMRTTPSSSRRITC